MLGLIRITLLAGATLALTACPLLGEEEEDEPAPTQYLLRAIPLGAPDTELRIGLTHDDFGQPRSVLGVAFVDFSSRGDPRVQYCSTPGRVSVRLNDVEIGELGPAFWTEPGRHDLPRACIPATFSLPLDQPLPENSILTVSGGATTFTVPLEDLPLKRVFTLETPSDWMFREGQKVTGKWAPAADLQRTPSIEAELYFPNGPAGSQQLTAATTVEGPEHLSFIVPDHPTTLGRGTLRLKRIVEVADCGQGCSLGLYTRVVHNVTVLDP
jgi:hypothetical protein